MKRPGSRARYALIIALALIAAVPGIASAEAFRYTLEHEARPIGTVHYERIEAGNRIRTRELLTISLQSSTGRQLLRMDRTWEETQDGQPLRYTQRLTAGTASQSLSARVRGNELLVTRRLGDQQTTTGLAVPPALVFPAALATRIEAQATNAECVLRYHELAMNTGKPELVELRARARSASR